MVKVYCVCIFLTHNYDFYIFVAKHIMHVLKKLLFNLINYELFMS